MDTNPVLDELDGLSPQAKNALALAHTRLAQAAPPPPGTLPAPAPAAQPGASVGQPAGLKPIAAPMPPVPTLGPPSSTVGPPSASDSGTPALPASLPAAPSYVNPIRARDEGELARLTAPPLAAGDPNAHTKLDTGVSGIDQIHSKWARVPLKILDAVGSTLFPRLAMGLPGTELHHSLLVNHAENAVNEDAALEQNRARESEAEARRGHELAETDALEHPRDEFTPLDTASGIVDVNRKTGAATPLRDPDGRPLMPFEKSPKQTVKEFPDEQGNLWSLHNDGSTTPINGPDGRQLKAKPPAEKLGDDFAQFYSDYVKANRLPDTPENRMAARQKWAAASQAPQRAPQINVMIPNADGSYTARSVHPGETVASGAVTPAGMSSLNVPSAQSRSMSEMASSVLEQTPRLLSEIDQLRSKLGPGAGRWNELWVNKGGFNDPAFAGLDSDLDLYSSALVRTHFGARGGQQYREELRKQFREAQSPEDLKSRIEHADEWIQGYANIGKNKGAAHHENQSAPKAPAGGTAPAGSDLKSLSTDELFKRLTGQQ